VNDLQRIRKKGQITKAAQEVAQRAMELCPGCLPDISATSLDGSAPDDTDLLMDIFNVPLDESNKLRSSLRGISSPYLLHEGLVVTIILHSIEDTEKYYMDAVRRINSAPETIKWISERYDDLLKAASFDSLLSQGTNRRKKSA